MNSARLLASALFALVAGCQVGGPGNGFIASDADGTAVLEDDRACARGDECIIVDAGCCGCSQAGVRTAINAAARQRVENRTADACGGAACDAALSDDASCCAQTASCVSLRCELFGVGGDPSNNCE